MYHLVTDQCLCCVGYAKHFHQCFDDNIYLTLLPLFRLVQ